MSQTARGPVLVDIHGTQVMDHRSRGIARYVHDLALTLEDVSPAHIGGYLLNRDLALPADLERFVATGKLARMDEAEFGADTILHITSPYELGVPLHQLLPEAARRAGSAVVTTLYDLIPEVLADPYLNDTGLRLRYRARHQLMRSADAVLSLSEASRRDAIDRIGLDPHRVVVVGAGVDGRFTPPASKEAALAAAVDAVPGLRPPFVLYTGGTDARKNVDGLLAAWARIPARVRDRYQLVIACGLKPLDRNHFETLADGLGILPGLLLPSYLTDPALLVLYQSTHLFVYPSLYEGYGLPVAEALACGAPVLAANRSALPELLGEEALFDPDDLDGMAAVIGRGLTDGHLRAGLLARAGRAPHDWAGVARRTVEAYDRVLAHRAARAARGDARRRSAGTSRPAADGAPRTSTASPGPATARRPRIAFVSPLPPQPGGVSDYSASLLAELRAHADIHAFVDGPPHFRPEQRAAAAPAGVELHRVAGLQRVEALTGHFDAVIYALGNSEFHTGALSELRRRPGTVLAHDVRLTELYAFGPHQHPRAVPGGFHAALQAMYGNRIPAELGADGRLAGDDAERWGVLMAREVIALSERFVVSSRFAAEMARLEASPGDAHKIDVLPLALGTGAAAAAPRPSGERAGPPVVATFGLVNATKQTGVVLESFASTAAESADATLAVVGLCGEVEAAALRSRAAELGVAERVTVTGRVDDAEYGRWLGRATVAVQLRAGSNGETSAATGAALAAGVPTVVSAVGAARELPDDVALKVPPGAGPEELARAVAGVLRDPARRRALGDAAAAYAATRSFARTAEALLDLVLSHGDRARPGASLDKPR